MRGNDREAQRHRIEDKQIEAIDRQGKIAPKKSRRPVDSPQLFYVSVFALLKIGQPAIAYELGLMAGYEMREA